jgi:hypothetical protein
MTHDYKPLENPDHLRGLAKINRLIRRHTAYRGALHMIRDALRSNDRPRLRTMTAESVGFLENGWHPVWLTANRRRKQLETIADFYDAAMTRFWIGRTTYRC